MSGFIAGLPVVTIVTPSFNQGRYLEETICSVLDQGYPNLEYIVVDGGSTDNSVDIIKKYQKYLAWWVSEKDRGQSHAINKGLERATGEVANWLCADDQLEPGALQKIGAYFSEDERLDVLVGASRWVDGTKVLRVDIPNMEQIKLMPWSNFVSQPSCFYRRRLLNRRPAVDESMHYAMDLELWAYFQSRGAKWKCCDEIFSTYLWHGANKTMTGGTGITAELARIHKRYTRDYFSLPFLIERVYIPLVRYRGRAQNRLCQMSAGGMFRILHQSLRLMYGKTRADAKISQYVYFLVR